jgi:MFS family permease
MRWNAPARRDEAVTKRRAAEREPLLTARFVVVVTSGTFYFMALGALLPVVPRYVDKRLGGNDVAVGVAVGALAVGEILLRPLAGRLGDRFGRRVLMVGGAFVVALTAAGAGLVESLPWLIATRFGMGLGEACFFVGGTTMATDLAPESRRGEAVSYWSVAVWTGLGFGPVVGEALLGGGSQYDLVWLAAGASALVASLVALTTRETRVVHEHADRGKLIAPAAVRPGIILAATLIGITGFSVFLPLYGPEIGVDDVGLVFLVYGVVVLGVRIVGAKLPDRLGPVAAASIAIGSTAIGLAIAALWHSVAGVFAAALVIAVGSSFLYPAALLLSLRGVPEYQRASVVGTLSAFFDFAGGASGIILGVVAAISSYQGAFGASAVLAALALVMLRSGFAGHREGVVPTVAEVAPATAEPTSLP